MGCFLIAKRNSYIPTIYCIIVKQGTILKIVSSD